MDEDYTGNPAIFPSEEAMKNSESAVFPGQERMQKIDEAWTRVKAAS